MEEQGPVPLGWQWTCFTSVRGGLDSRARRVGGGSGDDFGRRVPVGGFRSQAPGHRFGYDFGPPSFEFERARLREIRILVLSFYFICTCFLPYQ